MTSAVEQPQLATVSNTSVGSLYAVDVMSGPVVSVQLDCGLLAAWNVLQSHGVHHLVVLDGGRVAGVVRESDLLLAWADQPFVQPGQRIRQLVRPRTPSVITSDPLAEVAETLLREDMRAVPVVTPRGQLVGVVTATDILRAVSEAADGEPSAPD
jgi:CBS domain-containing protein